MDACFTDRKLPNITNQMRQMLLNRSAFCSKSLTTDRTPSALPAYGSKRCSIWLT